MSDLRRGDIYQHDNHMIYAKLIRWQGDSESGGAATVELSGEETTMGLALFLRKFNVITVQELVKDRYNAGQTQE